MLYNCFIFNFISRLLACNLEGHSMKNRRMRILYFVMVVIFSVTFSLGIFGNPNFSIHDFCMNLSSEILGLLIAVIFVDNYVKYREENSKNNREKNKMDAENE